MLPPFNSYCQMRQTPYLPRYSLRKDKKAHRSSLLLTSINSNHNSSLQSPLGIFPFTLTPIQPYTRITSPTFQINNSHSTHQRYHHNHNHNSQLTTNTNNHHHHHHHHPQTPTNIHKPPKMYSYKTPSKSSNSRPSSESTESLNPNPYLTVTASQASHDNKKKKNNLSPNNNNTKQISDEDLLQHTGMTLAQIRERARDRAGVAGNRDLDRTENGNGNGKGVNTRLESFAFGFTRGLGGYA